MMNKVFFDINVILDVFMNRELFVHDSGLCLTLVNQGKIKGYLSAHAITTIEYLLRGPLKKAKVSVILTELMERFTIIDTTEKILTKALTLQFNDFEDAVSYCAALSADSDLILTRNIKDYKTSSIPVFSPNQLILKLTNK